MRYKNMFLNSVSSYNRKLKEKGLKISYNLNEKYKKVLLNNKQIGQFKTFKEGVIILEVLTNLNYHNFLRGGIYGKSI